MKSHLQQPHIWTIFNYFTLSLELIDSDNFFFCKIICQLPDIILFDNQLSLWLIISNNIIQKFLHFFLFIMINFIRIHSEFSLEKYMPINLNKFAKFLAGLRILLEELIKFRLILWQIKNFDLLLVILHKLLI